MTARDARLVLVEGTDGDGAVIDHDSLAADTRVGVEDPGFREYVVNAVLDTYADAPANGYTVARVALTWTDEVDADAKLVLDALAEQGVDKVAVVSTADAESYAGAANSVEARSVVRDDDAALLARGALLASADIRDEAASAPMRDPVRRTLAKIMTTAALIVAGSVFVAITVHGNDGGVPQQASAPVEHTVPAPPAAPAEPPIHTVVRKVVPMAGRAAAQSLSAPYADTSMPPSTGVVRR
ncbi:hypothetical protein FR943_02305 [Mycobacterium sp. TNTM28]|uniref:DUF7159 domain-containing protein n=1 Tax=[Mycobacterium] fortunisiensis TaxID=2600579 RepID=A0ABS6KGJ8_9MYCO|nr:hypothetical protein [[Mycobacterium] fortunisiensis]MBU9762685.1 hypothetical protein [[Mycobacterium] fortunisiensis]